MLHTNRFTYNKTKEEIIIMQEEVLDYLKSMSKHEFIIFDEKDYRVTRIISEVTNLTDEGINYINLYYDAVEELKNIGPKPKAIEINNWVYNLIIFVGLIVFIAIILIAFKIKRMSL